jgi:hypothetical protein
VVGLSLALVFVQFPLYCLENGHFEDMVLSFFCLCLCLVLFFFCHSFVFGFFCLSLVFLLPFFCLVLFCLSFVFVLSCLSFVFLLSLSCFVFLLSFFCLALSSNANLTLTVILPLNHYPKRLCPCLSLRTIPRRRFWKHRSANDKGRGGGQTNELSPLSEPQPLALALIISRTSTLALIVILSRTRTRTPPQS